MKKALVIGIDKYPNAPLYGSVNDATEFASLIESNEDSDNFDVQLEKNVPTKSDLLKLIKTFFKGDSLIALLYFSGHGRSNEYGAGYLLTPDVSGSDLGVSMDEILNIANKSKARNKIIILDCCSSGAMGSPGLLGGEASLISEGVTILTASREDEAAKEQYGQGVFTGLLLEALKGGAADLRGYITPASIYAYIDQALGELHQRPVFKTNTTRFVSLRKVKPQVPQQVFRKITDYFKESNDKFNLNPSFEDTNIPGVKKEPVIPFAIHENVSAFKHLQMFQSVGLVVPLNANYMYDAAMQSESCELTPLGRHYWRLVKNKMFKDY